MQCTERGESKRSPEEDVSAGNGAISYIQSGITVDEKRAASKYQERRMSGGERGRKMSRLDCSARENEMAPQHASCRPETKALGARRREQNRETSRLQINAETEVEEDRQSKAKRAQASAMEEKTYPWRFMRYKGGEGLCALCLEPCRVQSEAERVSQQIGGQLKPGRDDGRIMGDFWREDKPRHSSQQRTAQHRTDLA
ncbi:hypothetical protein MKX08_006375 [Trichoderma sp. CBMAI-0020]|nr:hypothetical protein MKX08_006375 [Trichoderma sp. CBMAI-0020]